eukprot:4442294-Amphidinium_carterae.1
MARCGVAPWLSSARPAQVANSHPSQCSCQPTVFSQHPKQLGTQSLWCRASLAGGIGVVGRASRTLRHGQKSAAVVVVDLEDVSLTEDLGQFYESRLDDVVDRLQAGGLGIIPTDSQASWLCVLQSIEVTSLSCGGGLIYEVKDVPADTKKPLSLLCSDLSMASAYADIRMLDRKSFQAMRRCLPGCYTFILRATPQVPRVVVKHKSRRRKWQRREVGIRVPDNRVVQYLVEQLGEPLLASSACERPS